METSIALPQVDETIAATTRYLQALTRLDDASAAGPSTLPGWSRAHVVAHVSRNADAFSRALGQAAAGSPASMYDTQDARDRDVAQTLERYDAAGLVRDARDAALRLETALTSCAVDPSTPYSRLAGDGDTFPLSTIGMRRWSEVEIHHADLDLGYDPGDWPTDFSRHVVRQRQDELAAAPGGGPSMVLSATDVPGLWKLGRGAGPEIHGTVGELAWWLVGRGGGRGLVCEGELPVLGRWR